MRRDYPYIGIQATMAGFGLLASLLGYGWIGAAMVLVAVTWFARFTGPNWQDIRLIWNGELRDEGIRIQRALLVAAVLIVPLLLLVGFFIPALVVSACLVFVWNVYVVYLARIRETAKRLKPSHRWQLKVMLPRGVSNSQEKTKKLIEDLTGWAVIDAETRAEGIGAISLVWVQMPGKDEMVDMLATFYIEGDERIISPEEAENLIRGVYGRGASIETVRDEDYLPHQLLTQWQASQGAEHAIAAVVPA